MFLYYFLLVDFEVAQVVGVAIF